MFSQMLFLIVNRNEILFYSVSFCPPKSITNSYYITSFASGQDESNCALWLAPDNPPFPAIKFCPFNFLGCCRRELGMGPNFLQMRKAREAAGIDLFLIQITITVRDQAVKPGLHMLGKSQTIGDSTFFRPSQILPI